MLVALLVVLVLGACDGNENGDQFDRHLETCTVARNNGLLDAAVEACGAALSIADDQAYGSDQVSRLLLQLGRLERQRGNFEQAEPLLSRSLAIEEASGNPGAVAARLLELALVLAGENRWLEGTQLLERAAPLLNGLPDEDLEAAANVYRGFSRRLQMLGHTEQAIRLLEISDEISLNSSLPRR